MSTPIVVTFTVAGIAQPKGSARAFMPKGARFPVVTSDNKSLKGWEANVRSALQHQAAGLFFSDAVAVRITFHLPRPKSKPKRITSHTTKPDVDKLARGAIDAMTGVLFKDDAQVTDLHARKVYAETQPHAVIEVEGTAVVTH